jgi:hypothetical protein
VRRLGIAEQIEGPAVSKVEAGSVNVARIGPKRAACRGKWKKRTFNSCSIKKDELACLL